MSELSAKRRAVSRMLEIAGYRDMARRAKREDMDELGRYACIAMSESMKDPVRMSRWHRVFYKKGPVFRSPVADESLLEENA